MADKDIQTAFIDGIHEVFSTMFTDGVNDGIYLYLMSDKTKTSVYGETKYKIYKQPVLLVSKVQLSPTQQNEDTRGIIESATFTVPRKSLTDNEIDISNQNLPTLRKAVIKYKDTFYTIDNVSPNGFVEDVFLTYVFSCTEDLETTELVLEEVEVTPNE